MRSKLKDVILTMVVFSITFFVSAAQRTFVSSQGLDTNPCTVSAPCRSFSAALALTEDGGEVIVLDSAGYGAFTVSQSVSVIAPAGIYAGISVFSGTGVIVNGSGIRVVLTGLSINGLGGHTGIDYSFGESVTLRDCQISNMVDWGVRSKYGNELHIGDTEIRRSGESGLFIQGGTVVIEQSRLVDNLGAGIGVDLAANGTAAVTVVTSSMSGNSASGLYVATTANFGGSASVLVDRSVSTGNGNGFVVITGEPALLVVSRSLVSNNTQFGVLANGEEAVVNVIGSTIVRNEIGLGQFAGSIVRSMQNNTIEHNLIADTDGTISLGTLK